MEQRLHPNVIRYWQIKYGLNSLKWILIGSIPLITQAVWLQEWRWLKLIPFLFIPFFLIKGLAFICFGVYKKYSRRSYLIESDELLIRWGNVWADNSSIIPLSRVQHVDQEQDILAKKLGLSELIITTAADDHYIIGLAEQDAVRLRRHIIELSKLDGKDAYYD